MEVIKRPNDDRDAVLMDKINESMKRMSRPKHNFKWIPTWVYRIFQAIGLVKSKAERYQTPPPDVVVGKPVYYKTATGVRRYVGTITGHDPQTKQMDFTPLTGKNMKRRHIRGKKLFAEIDGSERFLGVGTR